MTREEAANVLRSTWLNAGRVNGKTVFAEALNMAIKALETQPDGDTISRQAALNIVYEIDTFQAGWRFNAMNEIKALPSAKPEVAKDTNVLSNDCISRQAAIDAFKEYEKRVDTAAQVWTIRGCKDEILKLPSAQSEDCDTCKHGYFGDIHCETCRVRYPSHYERRTE